MEYYVKQKKREHQQKTRRESFDMIQMNNKIVYCVKDHHGVAIKTSKNEDKAKKK